MKISFDGATLFSVYPNPVTSHNLFVNYIGGNVKDIKLISADARQIGCGFVSQTNNQIKVFIPGGTAKGTYMLQVLTDDGKINRTKILIQ